MQVLQSALEFGGAHGRAHGHAVVQAVAHLAGLGFGDQFFGKFIGYTFLNNRAAGGGAHLTGHHVAGHGHELGGMIEIGIGQYDGGVLAPHLHLRAGHARGELLVNAAADRVRAGEGQGLHGGIGGQFVADLFAAADHNIEYALR